MKRLFCALFVLLIPVFVFSQWSGYYTDKSELDGGLGMTWIDNNAYYTISFQPDIQIGKIGVGLGINLLYSAETGKIRSKDWNSSNSVTRLIRYLRYGHKGDPFYARVGALDAERIGHGFILNYYNNQIDYDGRKIGLSLDADFGLFGFESMTNNLARLEVIGGRGYVRPLYNSDMPILKRLAFGASVVTDAVPDFNDPSKKDRITEWGIDVELPLIKTDALKMLLYADHAQIVDYGSGQTIGLRTDFNTLWGFLGLTVNLERRNLGKRFISNYFGPFYEVLRYTTIGEVIDFYESMGGNPSGIPSDLPPAFSGVPVGQYMLLDMMNQKRNGWYGALDLDFFHLIRVIGAYQKMDNLDNSGELHLGAGLAKTIPLVDVQASYDKRGLESAKDLFTLDNRSVARVGVGYKIKPYLLLYMDYIWSFTWDETLGQFKPQERVQPRLAFRYPFSL
jgi:hypothetical protein